MLDRVGETRLRGLVLVVMHAHANLGQTHYTCASCRSYHRDIRPESTQPRGAAAGERHTCCVDVVPPQAPPQAEIELFRIEVAVSFMRRSILRTSLSWHAEAACAHIRWSWRPWSTAARAWCAPRTPPPAGGRASVRAKRSSAPGEVFCPPLCWSPLAKPSLAEKAARALAPATHRVWSQSMLKARYRD